MFFKKDLKEDLDKLLKRVELIEINLSKLEKIDFELELEKFKTQLISLRGLVNRKLGKDAGETTSEEFKSVDGLDKLRNL